MTVCNIKRRFLIDGRGYKTRIWDVGKVQGKEGITEQERDWEY